MTDERAALIERLALNMARRDPIAAANAGFGPDHIDEYVMQYGVEDFAPEVEHVLYSISEAGHVVIPAAEIARLSEEARAGNFQARVKPWMDACFGSEISADKVERNDRFIEEALELVQACGYTKDRAHALVDYVFNRPQGEINQEVGGVMVTLAALCLAHGVDMHAAAETELTRVWTKIDRIREKQAAKPTGSALPVAGYSAAEEARYERARADKAVAQLEATKADFRDFSDTRELMVRDYCALVDALGVDMDAPPAVLDDVRRHGLSLSALNAAREEARALREALEYARPILEKWCHYQGDAKDFVAQTLAPIDAALARANGGAE